MDMLLDIGYSVSRKFSKFKVATSKLEYYYHHSLMAYLRVNNSIFLTIRVPLSVSQHKFDLFQLMTFPIPINSTTTHATKVQPLPPYLAVDPQTQQFVEMSNHQYNQCVGSKWKHCDSLLAQRKSTSPTCASTLLANDNILIKTLCQFTFIVIFKINL